MTKIRRNTRKLAAVSRVPSVIMSLLAFAAVSSPAQDWARQKLDKSPRHSEWVMVKQGDRVVQTFVAYPEVKTKAPVVLVIHEIFGLSDWAEEVADEFAAAGYIAVAPDLLGDESHRKRDQQFRQVRSPKR